MNRAVNEDSNMWGYSILSSKFHVFMRVRIDISEILRFFEVEDCIKNLSYLRIYPKKSQSLQGGWGWDFWGWGFIFEDQTSKITIIQEVYMLQKVWSHFVPKSMVLGFHTLERLYCRKLGPSFYQNVYC